MKRIIKSVGMSLEVLIGSSVWLGIEVIQGTYHQVRRIGYEIDGINYGRVSDNSETLLPRYRKLEIKNNSSH